MAESDWVDIPRSSSDGDWVDIVESEKPSPFVSGVRGAIQGATGGFVDEMTGLLEAGGQAIGLKGLGGPVKDIGISKSGPTLNMDVLKMAYQRSRDRERKIQELDMATNPISSGAGQIIGGVASPINKIAKGASLAKQGATIGALNSLGTSEADNALDMAKDVGIGSVAGLVIGKGAERAGNYISGKFSRAAEKIRPPETKMNAEEIKAAADRLGIKVTPGMLDDSGFVERLESSLSKSPSYFGQKVAKAQKNVSEKLADASQRTLSEASVLSPYETGEKFKSALLSRVGERLDPISAVFDDVRESTKHIGISDKSKAAIVRNIENIDSYRLTGGAGKPRQFVDMIGRLKNADQVKTMMTLLNGDIKDATGAEKQVLIAIKGKLEALERNSIMRSAIEAARDGKLSRSTGEKIGTEIINDLKGARSAYRTLADDLNSVSESSRVKFKGGPSAFLNSVEDIPSEKIGEKFLNVGNNRQIQSLAQKFPEEFNLLKQGKIKDIADRSIDNSLYGQGKHSTQKFLNEIRKLSPEAQYYLLGKNMSVVNDIETIQRSLPRNFNPSGTGSEAGWKDAIYQNVKDVPNYLLYKGASSNLASEVSDALLKSPKMRNVYEKNPQLFQNIINQIELKAGVFNPIFSEAASKGAAVAENPEEIERQAQDQFVQGN